MENEINEEYASLALKRFYNNTTDEIQMSALINRALTDKISTETISKKVNNQLNSINASMYNINPKFTDGVKKYDVVKQEILEVLTDYELALTKLSDCYDKKLEELILKKVELESNLVGKIFVQESFNNQEVVTERKIQNDKLKLTFAEKTKNIFEKFSLKKKENIQNAIIDIEAMQDNVDMENERAKKINSNLENEKAKNDLNVNEIKQLEEQIKNLAHEITNINEKKRILLEEAMETKDKWVAVNLKKPNPIVKVKTYFANRFNTQKVIKKTVIMPLKNRVDDFNKNELSKIKEGLNK